jgi:Cytokinin dehydrogenase 1, FAD and cytokinin binding
MTSNGSANEAPRGTRAKELNNAETGGRNDIITIILANGASDDFKERLVLRSLSREMRVKVEKWQRGNDAGPRAMPAHGLMCLANSAIRAAKFSMAGNWGKLCTAGTVTQGSFRFGSRTVRIMTYVEYTRRQPSLPSAPHPWDYLCLPASKYLEYAKRVFDTPAEAAYSSPRFSMWRRNSIKRPLTHMPNEALIVRFQCSRLPPASADMSAVLAMNRTLYERARDLGGTHLTTSAIPLSQDDWVQQYGPGWKAFRAAKRRFDPNNVLNPGPGIFPLTG